MRRDLFAFGCTASLLSTAFPGTSAAQPQQTSPQAAWQLTWHSPFCQLSTGSLKTVALGVWAIPGSPGVDLYFVGANGSVPKVPRGSAAMVQLSPVGTTLKTQVSWRTPYWTGVLRLGFDGEHVMEQFRQASALDVRAGDKTLSMQVPGMDKAILALKGCLDSHLKDWGIDGAALSALKAWPHAKGWISPDDYPLDALQGNVSGVVVVKLTIDPTGRVTNCLPVWNSGTKSMEQATCGAAVKRAHFSPAIGADGQPTSATFMTYSEFSVAS